MHLTTKIFTPKNSESNSDQKTCKSKKKFVLRKILVFVCKDFEKRNQACTCMESMRLYGEIKFVP